MKYISAQKTQLLDSLENQVLFADLASVIIGRKGLGKSFLLEQLHQRLQDKVYISEIVADSVMTPEQLNKSICLQLGLSWQISQKELLTNIQSNIDQRVLISIDNAHLFSVECLNFLLSLILPQEEKLQNLIYIVLTGEVVLANKLGNTETLKFYPNICVVFELEPFELKETKYFISELQSLDISKIEVLYDEQKLNYLWQLSLGNPRELTSQLNRWLENTQTKKQSRVLIRLKSTPLRQYLLAISYSSIAVCLILVLVYQDQINQIISPSRDLSAENKEANAIVELDATDDIEVKDLIPLNKINANIENSVDEIVLPEPAGIDVSTEKLESLKHTDNAEKTKPSLIMNSVPTAASQENLLGSEKTASKKNKANTNEFGYSADEKDLLTLSDNSFVIQWMGVSTKESAETFKLSHPLKKELRVYRRKYKSGYLYLIVSGDYQTKQQVDKAKQQFETINYPGQPWIKSVKAVKKELLELP